MPTISVFIRKDDLPKWKALEHKSEWMSEHLSMPKFGKMKLSEEPVPQVTKTRTTGFVQVPGKLSLEKNLCEHFQLKGQCLVRGCKYGN